jgi:Arc/MetJ-type ribon-helix-helix transcriptional regulator
MTRKPRVVTFRMDQATWDFMRALVPYTRYKNASSFIREGIDLLLKQEDEQPSGWSVGQSPGGSQTKLSVHASSDLLKTSTLSDARHHRG